MSFGLKQSSYEAVLYVNRSKVLKEMLYSEFEAVLDQVVSEPAYLDETCHAVYLKIDIRLNIVAAVFFCIDFDKQGNADRRWNL
ncbi:MAG: chromosome partitioning protein ParA, partial [Pseudomonadales bacterium]